MHRNPRISPSLRAASSTENPIEIRKIRVKGRGVFANRPFKQGDVIESAPAASFEAKEREIADQTGIFEYYFVKAREYAESHNVAWHIVFGLSSICNHSVNPNAYVEWEENDLGTWAHLIATKDIHIDEEITLYYTNIEEYPRAAEFLEE